MHEGRICIAGYDQMRRCHVRPILPYGHLMEGFLTRLPGRVVRPFTLLDFRFLYQRSDPPHTEDTTFEEPSVQYAGDWDASTAFQFLKGILDRDVAGIFGAPVCEGRYVVKGQGTRSLGTVQPTKPPYLYLLSFKDSGLRYRLTFEDASGVSWDLPITDLHVWRAGQAWLEKLGSDFMAEGVLTGWLQQREVILRIGLARGWKEYPDRCYLQVTAVYAYPGPDKDTLTVPLPEHVGIH